MPTILRLITRNASREPATIRLPGSAPVPPGFRGPVTFDGACCLACGLCAYVCVSDAITGEDGDAAYGWAYDPGRCTFCARCVDHCPGHALSMAPAPARAYARPGELAKRATIVFQPCPRCSAPARRASDAIVRAAFGRVTEETRALARLCERCRRRRVQRDVALGAGLALAADEEGER